MDTKLCWKCKQEKPLDEFRGSTGMCRLCNNAYSAEWKRNHRTKATATSKAYRQRLKEKTGRAYSRDYHLRKMYGITEERFNAMVAEQSNRCAACSILLDPPVVDHDHVTGEVRGLLCMTCNKVLGLLKDSAEVLDNLSRYLKLRGPTPWWESERFPPRELAEVR